MDENFPMLEKAVFEEIYGKDLPSSKPITNPKEIKITDKQEITCSFPHTVTTPIFKDPLKNEISDFILKIHSPPNYLSFTDLLPSNYKMNDLLMVYRELELRNLINYKPKVKLPKSKANIWSKIEKLKLLEAIENFGDDWSAIEKYTQKNKADCILKFLKMDLNVTKLVHPNRMMAEIVFLSSRVHPTLGSVLAKECLEMNRNPNYQKIIDKAEEQLLLEKNKLERLTNVLLEALSLRIKEKMNDFKNILNSVEREKNEIKEEIIDYEKDIKELNEFIKEMKNSYEEN